MKKLWLSESRFVEVPEGPAEAMGAEIAVRSRRPDFWGMFNYLPDPDLVLQKLGSDMTIYRQLLTDAHVGSCMISRKGGSLSAEWEIRPPEAGGSRVNKNVVKFVEDMMEGLDVYRIISDILDAPFFGMSPLEITWRAVNEGRVTSDEGRGTTGKWIPGRVEGKPPEWFVFSPENRLRFVSTENQITGEAIPPMKVLLPRHFPSYINPYGDRLLSRCFWPVAFKKGGFKYWAVFTEKFGMPWVVGKVPPRTNETERAALLAKLVSMVQDAVAVVNDDASIEMPEAKGKTGSADIYDKLIHASNSEISKAILGQTLTTEIGDKGSYAASQSHMEVRGDLVDQDKRLVKTTFDQLFRWVIDLNFAPGTEPPLFAWFEEEDVQKDRAERDKTLSDQGVKFKAEYYQRVYNLEEGEFEVRVDEGRGTRDEGRGARDEGEFREMPQDRFSQADVDDLSRRAAIASSEAVSALLEPVLTEIDGAKSFEEIGERLYALYPDLDSSRFQDLLARAMFASSLVGYGAAEREK